MRWAALPLLVALQAALLPSSLRAQVPADPVLEGQVLLGDSVMRSAVVVLHRVSEEVQGEVDSVRVSRDGAFSFRLPAVPDPERSEVYFASVRHSGVLYFGKAITLAVQLDSVYEIQAYDTILAPQEGAGMTVQARNIFVEEGEGGRWQVTDLFQIRNDEARTVVAREGGVVWRHSLPDGAADVEAGQGDFGGGAEVEGNDLVVTGPTPPGERLFVVRYTVPDPFMTLALPHPTETLEVMVREPAPALEAPGLEVAAPVQWDEGETFRRLVGAGLGAGSVVRLAQGREARLPPVRWMAVILSLVLAGVGLWAVQRSSLGAPRPRAGPPQGARQALVLEIARLDEDFAARPDPTPEERGAYEARRSALLRRLIQLG